MTRRVEFEIVDHGCDGEQYFPGCGVAFTSFDGCVTGIGDSAREAAEDACEVLSQGLPDGMTWDAFADLDREVAEMSDAPSFDAEDPEISPEWHHYVSIRWRVIPRPQPSPA
jgi:hypothetical protein